MFMKSSVASLPFEAADRASSSLLGNLMDDLVMSPLRHGPMAPVIVRQKRPAGLLGLAHRLRGILRQHAAQGVPFGVIHELESTVLPCSVTTGLPTAGGMHKPRLDSHASNGDSSNWNNCIW